MLQHSCVCLYLFSPPVPSSDPVTVTTSKAKVEVHENTSKLLSLQIISWTCLKAFRLTLYLFFAKDAVLSCEFRTEKETNPRVEWKKRGKDVSYVYFDGEFTGGLLFCPFQNVLQPIFISLDILWNLLKGEMCHLHHLWHQMTFSLVRSHQQNFCKILQAKKAHFQQCSDDVWSTAHTDVAFKPCSFLLVNAEPTAKSVYGNAKLPIAQIPIDMTGFRPWNFAKQW